mmetsp:Transcript_39476/g.108762  ORF Transcript_39476/g.108762 Transcript_39476/m.108762 type:complete len:84 (-) Transcript_39476:264-515(-)
MNEQRSPSARARGYKKTLKVVPDTQISLAFERDLLVQRKEEMHKSMMFLARHLNQVHVHFTRRYELVGRSIAAEKSGQNSVAA